MKPAIRRRRRVILFGGDPFYGDVAVADEGGDKFMESRPSVPVLPKMKRKPAGNRKLRMIIILFFISIFILIFFHSPLSKVSAIEIVGNRFTDEEAIIEAAGIAVEDSFFAVRPERAEQKIVELEMVEQARVVKKFPGQIRIEVEEYDHVAFERIDGKLAAVLANGASIPLGSEHALPDKPILSGWEGHDELKRQLCKTLATIPIEWLVDISEIWPDPTSTYEDRIVFYSRSSFEVTTTVSKLAEKMAYFYEIVDELKDQEQSGGRLILLEADTFIPFEANGTAD